MALKMDIPNGEINNLILYNQLFSLGSSRTPQQEIDFQNLFTSLSIYLVLADDYNELTNDGNQIETSLTQVNRDVAQLYLQDAIYRLLGEVTSKMPSTQSRFFETPEVVSSNSVGHIDFTKAYCTSATQGTNTITIDSMLNGEIDDFMGGRVFDKTTPIQITSDNGDTSGSSGDKIVEDSNGNFYMTYDFGNQIYVKKSTDGGDTWINMALPLIVGYSQYNPSITIDSNDNLHVVWTGTDSGSGGLTQVKYSKFTTSWSAWINISVVAGYSASSVSIAVDSLDNLHVVWSGADSGSTLFTQIKYSKFTTSWSAWINISLIAGYSQGIPDIAINSSNELYVVWYGKDVSNPTYNQIKYSKFTTSWSSWDNVSIVNGYSQTAVSVHVDKLDRVHVVWNGMDVDNVSATQIKYSKLATSWSTWINISSITFYYQQFPVITSDDKNNLHVIWSGTDPTNFNAQIKYKKFTTEWSLVEYITDGKTGTQTSPSVLRFTNKNFDMPIMVWTDYQDLDIKFYGRWITGNPEMGKDVTLQDITSKECLIIQSVNNNVITFTSNIINSYAGDVNIYRSSIKVVGDSWEFEGIKYGSDSGIWDETLTPPSGAWDSPVLIGADIYARQSASPYAMWKYDTITKLWDETSTPPSDSWVYPIAVGTDIYVRGASPYAMWKYDTITKLWDETSTPPSGSWVYPIAVGTNIYVRGAIPYAMWKYDTITKLWDETSTPPSGAWAYIILIGTNIYVRGAIPYAMWKYDTITKLWDETSTPPSGAWDYPIAVGTDIYVRSASPYAMWKYDTITKLWDEISTPPSGAWAYIIAVGTDIYVRGASPYAMWKYDTITKLWDETSTPPSGSWAYPILIGTNIYVRGASPYAMWKYETLTMTEAGTTDIDVRLNINPYTDAGNISMWLLNNQLGTYTSSVSIVESGSNDDYVSMANVITEMTTEDEIYFVKSGLTPNSRVTAKINITRPTTATDVEIKQIIGGVF